MPDALSQPSAPLDLAPELSLYRDRTAALLRRYERLAVEVGRLPSLAGREVFRARVTHYHQVTFEDAVIFVHDVERCLDVLDARSRLFLLRIGMMDYSQDEVAGQLRLSPRRVRDLFYDALDCLSREFLRRGILRDMPPPPPLPAPHSHYVRSAPPDDEVDLDPEMLGAIAGVCDALPASP